MASESHTSMTYPEALRAIRSPGRFAVKLGLERTRALLHGMGDPERSVGACL
jgi:hypothetical protein